MPCISYARVNRIFLRFTALNSIITYHIHLIFIIYIFMLDILVDSVVEYITHCIPHIDISEGRSVLVLEQLYNDIDYITSKHILPSTMDICSSYAYVVCVVHLQRKSLSFAHTLTTG